MGPIGLLCSKIKEHLKNRGTIHLYEDIIEYLNTLHANYFDKNLVFTAQPKNLYICYTKLNDKYPDLFPNDENEGEDDLIDCARTFLMTKHHRARSGRDLMHARGRKRTRRRKVAKKARLVEEQEDEEGHRTPISLPTESGRNSDTIKVVRRALPEAEPLSNHDMRTPALPVEVPDGLEKTDRNSAAPSSSHLSQQQAQSHVKASITVSASRSDIDRVSQFSPPMRPNDPIYLFLAACQPSMTHYLVAFDEMGCRTEEDLYAMSTWPPQDLREELRTLLVSTGCVPSGLELSALCIGFKRCFGA